jgi:hypothetical protein
MITADAGLLTCATSTLFLGLCEAQGGRHLELLGM